MLTNHPLRMAPLERVGIYVVTVAAAVMLFGWRLPEYCPAATVAETTAPAGGDTPNRSLDIQPNHPEDIVPDPVSRHGRRCNPAGGATC